MSTPPATTRSGSSRAIRMARSPNSPGGRLHPGAWPVGLWNSGHGPHGSVRAGDLPERRQRICGRQRPGCLLRSHACVPHGHRVGVLGGSVSDGTGAISCPSTCAHAYTAGTQVTLTATGSAGSAFAGWSGGGCSGTGPCRIEMDADVTVGASFVAALFTGAPQATSSTTASFAGSVNPDGLPTTASFDTGSTRSTPAAAPSTTRIRHPCRASAPTSRATRCPRRSRGSSRTRSIT